MMMMSVLGTLICLINMLSLAYLNGRGNKFAGSNPGLMLTGMFVVGFFVFGTIMVSLYFYYLYLNG
jgi:hypothetical protein